MDERRDPVATSDPESVDPVEVAPEAVLPESVISIGLVDHEAVLPEAVEPEEVADPRSGACITNARSEARSVSDELMIRKWSV